MIKFIKGSPAIRFNEWLVIADPHLGLERDYWFKGYEIPSQKNSVLNRIKSLKGNSTKLMILGDIKHNIPNITYREEQEIPEFISELRRVFKEVVLIKGNHDGNLERLVSGVVKELFIDDVAFIHGHSVSEKALKSKKIIAGHMHPIYSYRNHLGRVMREKCFVITSKVIILPAFTDLSIGSYELANPLKKYIHEEERLLLDLTKVE